MSEYLSFIARKALLSPAAGIDDPGPLSESLFPFQRDIVAWALKRGRAAVFADTGLGKSRIQLEWARVVAERTGGAVLILAPLAVAQQTVREGASIGIDLAYCRSQEAAAKTGITITNYDMLHAFDPEAFSGVVLDESSIIKSQDGATRNALIAAFQRTPYRLACTATPAPNDHTELGNHAEFLGSMTRSEMLSTFFVHDGGETQTWRLKRHAERDFWRWCCSWACIVRRPSDLGYEDGAFELPPLELRSHVVEVDESAAKAAGLLFAEAATTLLDQRRTRKGTIDRRVEKVAALVAAEPTESWLVWCELNAEGDALTAAIPGAVQVAGADTREDKETRLLGFAEGRIRVLVSKPSLAGFGLNLQVCARQAFVGVSHSYEMLYQSIRRSWRFGQTRKVIAHMVSAETEGAIVANLKRKEADAQKMGSAMVAMTRELTLANVKGAARDVEEYRPGKPMRLPEWLREGA